MEHTFLFKEGLWRVEGEFLDGTGNRISSLRRPPAAALREAG